ncbi:MAG: hypothetical protein H6708_01220 [Kofleriaceae bacterium]|nr:hypothetical protein [Kofleriaceae bacterium]
MPPTCSWPGLPAAVAATAAVASAACVVEMDTERPASPIGAVTTDCVVPLPDRGAPAALEYPDGTLWIFDDGGAAFVASIDDACAGVVAAWPDPVLALTAEEEADDQTRTDGRAWALRPRGGVVAAGVGYLYYDRVLTGPGVFDVEVIDTGVCTIADRPGPCARAPAPLWPGGARSWGDAGFVEDGVAYVYGCDHLAAFTDLCALARVPVADVTDAAAYAYLGWDDAWRPRGDDTVTLFEAPGAISASRHAPSGRVMVTVADLWDSRLELRTAAGPAGGFDDPLVLFDVASPPDWFFAGGREHAGLREPGALAFSYATTAAPAPGLHVVRFQVADEGLQPW